ncbi:MAG: hypothetical protein AAFU71_13280, partial [Cyanobacteria bacterium J06632_22]
FLPGLTQRTVLGQALRTSLVLKVLSRVAKWPLSRTNPKKGLCGDGYTYDRVVCQHQALGLAMTVK